MKAFITGGAGFIGSNLSDCLLQNGHTVTIFDNFSTGQLRFLELARSSAKFRLIEGDLLDELLLSSWLRALCLPKDAPIQLNRLASLRTWPDKHHSTQLLRS